MGAGIYVVLSVECVRLVACCLLLDLLAYSLVCLHLLACMIACFRLVACVAACAIVRRLIDCLFLCFFVCFFVCWFRMAILAPWIFAVCSCSKTLNAAEDSGGSLPAGSGGKVQVAFPAACSRPGSRPRKGSSPFGGNPKIEHNLLR